MMTSPHRHRCSRAAAALGALLATLVATPAAAQTPTPRPEPGTLSMEMYFGHRPATEEACQVAKWGPRGLPSPKRAFRAAKVLTGTANPIVNGVVLVENGTIRAVGTAADTPIPEGYEVIDCGDGWITPGLVDLHCHVAAVTSGDINDSVHPNNFEFRTADLVTMDHPNLRRALAGGVTTVLYIPGSGSNSGGFGTLTKTHGADPESALVRFPGSLKIAHAYNPLRGAGDLGSTIMGMNDGMRAMFYRAQAYDDAYEAFNAGTGPKPKFDASLEYLRGLLRHEYPVSVHTQQYHVVLATITELRQEFGLWTVIVHGTMDAYPLTGLAVETGVPVCLGPRQFHYDGATSRFIGLAGTWYRGFDNTGLDLPYDNIRTPQPGLGRDAIAINTDSPVVPQEQLTVQAAMAVRLGLPHDVAIRGVTINPARMIGIDHRLGSLEPGKDADLVVWSGDPIDPRHHVRRTVVNGHNAYQRDPTRPLW